MQPFYKALCAAAVSAALLAGCNSSNSDSGKSGTNPDLDRTRIGILTDTQGGGDAVAVNQMEAILDLYRDNGVNIVIAVGDLTNSNTEHEYEQWKELASQYSHQITFLPLMGNHDRKPGDNYTWKRIMEEFIPKDNINHMPGRQYQTYAYSHENVLMVQISDQDMPYAFDWAEQVIANKTDDIDHVFVSSHSPFVGPYRGGVMMERVVARWNDQRENDMYTRDQEKWRKLFTDNDVIFVSGHDHQYSRSVIWDNGAGPDTQSFNTEPSAEPNHRFFHHIVTGNASEKGYYNRVGEFERIQSMVMYKTRYVSPKIPDLDDRAEWDQEMIDRDSVATGDLMVNASWFDINGKEIQYSAFYDTFTQSSDLLTSADWKLFDRFVRTPQRCDKVVYPTSVPFSATYYSAVDTNYRTVNCYSENGHRARLIDGNNQVFNRVDQALEGALWMGWTDADAMARMWDIMLTKPSIRSSQSGPDGKPSDRDFVVDGRSGLNYNHAKRFEIDEGRMRWYPATYDMKKLVSLSWLEADKSTESDILIVSGIQSQTGTYTNAFGAEKDITTEPGWPGTSAEDIEADGDHKNLNAIEKQPLAYDGLLAEKSPNRLNESRSWILDDSVRADDFVLEMAVPEGLDADKLTLAIDVNGEWKPLVDDHCISQEAYNNEFLTEQPEDIAGLGCDEQWTVGQSNNAFWAKVDQDGRFALIKK